MKNGRKPGRKKNTVIHPHSTYWETLANQLARAYCVIVSCGECGGPVIKGYCCTRCGSTHPETQLQHLENDHANV